MSESPCGCICAPRQSLVDCNLGTAAVGPSVASPNPWPGSVVCDAFTDYAPTRWRNQSLNYLLTPVATGPLVTNVWQSDTITVAGGRQYYDVLTVAGKDVGQVTLDRHYLSHPDPLFPAVVHFKNIRHLDEYNPFTASVTNPRNLRLTYRISVNLGDPLVTGFEGDYLPYASWLGEIPCIVTYDNYIGGEHTPICGSDYRYANLSVEFDYELTGPYQTWTQGPVSIIGSPTTTTPSFTESRHVSETIDAAFLTTSGAAIGVTTPIWQGDGAIWYTSPGNIDDPYFSARKSWSLSGAGYSPPSHPYVIDGLYSESLMSAFTITTSNTFTVILRRTTGQVECRMSGVANLLGSNNSGANSQTLLAPQDAEWFDASQELSYADSAFLYGSLAFYGPLVGSGPSATRNGGMYRAQIKNFAIRMNGVS